ncbi:hypothetical protein PTTG_28572 [Puccinia triticina 1-1 BBBD Race 1]|uniref:Uncharacterized protein n=1 Tax=Puccinia triticina (isolate 1-1 / race 1 (BBBD)) TaxID=630390 RepID=A0A180GB94_PUCT1|nr:hypothetical protein PTTG_28572 [Puccinia triticina 1-1 BBBD Race 1]
MSQHSPIFIPSHYTARSAREADNKEIGRLLSPNGIAPTIGDSFSQVEFDFLENYVLHQIIQYCHQNFPRNFTEQMNQIDLYCKIRDAFAMTNIHVFFHDIKEESPDDEEIDKLDKLPAHNAYGYPVYYGTQYCK